MKKIKKIVTTIACLLLSAATLLGASACTQEKEIVNAYDIAVKNGFVGTEQEWLLSLLGKNGEDGKDLDIYEVYQTAVAEEHYDGTFLEFLEEKLSVDVQEDNDTRTIARNVSSVVSVYCAFRQNSMNTRVTKVGGAAGSGVFLDYGFNKTAGTAYIVTNYHVVYDSSSVTSDGISDCIYIYPYGARNYFTDGDLNGDNYLDDANEDKTIDENDQGDMGGDGIRAHFIGGAMDYDVAILKVEGSEYLSKSVATAAKWGNSNEVRIGEKVFAVGNANGQGISVTNGLVSVDSENISMSALDGRDTNRDGATDGVTFRVMRTDAAINHGNSGGALFNAAGELIGITNAKNVEDETDNMGYALPSVQVKNLVGNILYNVENGIGGFVTRAMLGVTTSMQSSVATLDENGDIRLVEEIAVAAFGGTSTAAKGKLRIGDIFKTVTLKDPDDRSKTITYTVTRQYEINDLLLTVRKGDTVTFTVLREGEETDVEITFDNDGYFVKYA